MAVLCLEVPEITRNISLPSGYKLGLCNDHVVRTGRGKFTWNQRRSPQMILYDIMLEPILVNPKVKIEGTILKL